MVLLLGGSSFSVSHTWSKTGPNCRKKIRWATADDISTNKAQWSSEPFFLVFRTLKLKAFTPHPLNGWTTSGGNFFCGFPSVKIDACLPDFLLYKTGDFRQFNRDDIHLTH